MSQHISFIRNKKLTIEKPLKILLTGISSDSHTWNLVFIQLLIEHYGHSVVNLGACTPDELIIENCISEDIDMLVISSVNGHGHIDGRRLIKKIREHKLTCHLPCFIGGKLGTAGAGNVAYIKELLSEGFDAVYDDSQQEIPLMIFWRY